MNRLTSHSTTSSFTMIWRTKNSLLLNSKRQYFLRLGIGCQKYRSLCFISVKGSNPKVKHQLYGLLQMKNAKLHRNVLVAAFSSSKGADDSEKEQKEEKQKENTETDKGEGTQEDQEQKEPDYPEEKIGLLRMLAYLTVVVIAGGSFYLIGRTLLPSRMSPNYLFSEAFDVVRSNFDVINRYGEPIKGYGKDGGGRREGRRNFIEHREYTAEDGSKRLRIRFNIEGPFGHGIVFAEVASEMKKNEWMYILIQDMQTGKIITIEDNRAMYDVLARAKSPEEREAMRALIQTDGGGTQS